MNGNEFVYQAQVAWATDGETQTVVREGLTKRELFAAMALQGLLAGGWDHAGVTREGAETAVAYANHLLSVLGE